MKLAQCTAVESVSFFDAIRFFASIDYTATTATYSYAQMSQAVNTAAKAAESSGTVSPAGVAVQQYTSR